MKSLNHNINEYRKQLEKGVIVEAYRGIMDYLMKLRIYFKDHYPEHLVSGSIYQDFMDISFFSFTPEPLIRRKLKIVLVFVHGKTSFEVWLTGQNKQIQKEYMKLIRESKWNKYYVPSYTEVCDSIVENILVEKPDFDDLNSLTKKIEKGANEFIEDVLEFLTQNQLE